MYATTTQINQIGEWYEKKYIKFLLLESLKDRELAFLGTNNCNVRALRGKCLYDLETAFKLVNWGKNKPNMYRSVAKIKNIPNFTFNPKQRSSQTILWYENEFDKDIYEYDIFGDFDGNDETELMQVLEEVKELKVYLDNYQVPYYIQASGKKGFHLFIPGEYIPIEKIDNGVIYPHKTILENIKEMFSFKYMDLAHAGVGNKLCKVPYSLVGENVVLPLSDEQINNFSPEMIRIDKVLNNIPLIRRGVLERLQELSFEQKKKNVKNFIRSITFK